MKNNDIINAYKKWANTYDYIDNPTRDLDQKVLQQLNKNIKNKEVIEAGCGTGKNTSYLTNIAKRIISFDLSNEMLKQARLKIKKSNVYFIRQDITKKWPFSANCCDIVLINLVLEHIKRLNMVFSEAYRVLRNEGFLYICELHPDKQKKGSKATFIDPESKKVIKIKSFYHSKNEYLEEGIKVGFKDISLKEWYDDIDKTTPRLLSILLNKN